MTRALALTFVVLAVGTVSGRVFYLQSANDVREVNNAILPFLENREQSSRDLDLSFTAGDSVENENENAIQPEKKEVYTLVPAPDRPVISVNKEIDRPVLYYKLAKMSSKRNDRGDMILAAEKTPKQVKISGGKGDVVVELRVIANHDDA